MTAVTVSDWFLCCIWNILCLGLELDAITTG